MARKLVTEEELVAVINSELAKYEECENCQVNGIMKSEEDDAGCNWSEPYIRCSGVPAEVCRQVAQDVIGRVREEYNLE